MGEHSKARPESWWRRLGPGLVTGSSDDDPSGIATYTQAGARFGPQLLWTALVTYPLMSAIQEMCARIGLVTRTGLTGTIRRHYPRGLLIVILLFSFPPIILNIGADIAAMGAVANLLVPGVHPVIFSCVFTAILVYGLIQWNYARISNVLKWLCLSLFCYLLIPFLAEADWKEALHFTFVPHVEATRDYLMALVGILGTTISPYLFFWQTSMEVEEAGRQRRVMVDKQVISQMRMDVRGGMLFTNVVFYFIILAASTVLFRSGGQDIRTVEQAAEALRPLAGDLAYALFAAGILGTGFLAIPVLAGSLSYMMAETFGWEEGLNKKFHEARGFYFTLILALVLGLLIHLLDISPIRSLIYSAVLYGITAPVLIALILHISNNRRIMGVHTNSWSSNLLGWLALVLMTVCAVAMLVFMNE